MTDQLRALVDIADERRADRIVVVLPGKKLGGEFIRGRETQGHQLHRGRQIGRFAGAYFQRRHQAELLARLRRCSEKRSSCMPIATASTGSSSRL